jgi:hypothetical protein
MGLVVPDTVRSSGARHDLLSSDRSAIRGPSCHPLPSTGASVLSAPGESDEIYGSGLDTSYAQLDTTGACEATSMPESSWARTLVCAAFSG